MLRGDDKRVGRAIWRRHLASPTQVDVPSSWYFQRTDDGAKWLTVRIQRAGHPGGSQKSTILAAALAAASLALAGSTATAGSSPLDPGLYKAGDAHLQPVVLRAHTCMARSVVAVGYWTATSLTLARRQSLVQCALTTPRAYACYVVSCS
jgi:hypothetical protein